MRRAFKILALLTLLCLAAAACDDGVGIPEIMVPDTTPQPADVGIIMPVKTSVGLAFSEETLNPVLSKNRINTDLYGLMYDGLFKLDASFHPRSWLCESYTLAENVMVIRLRGGLRFSDGSALSAEDVVYSLNLARNNSQSPYYSRLRKIRSIAANADGTVSITGNSEIGTLPALLDIPIIKKDTGGSSHALGSGRYVFHSDAEGNYYLEENAGWWNRKGPMPITRFELIPVPDYDAMLFSYDSYDIDFINTETVSTRSVIISGASDMMRYDTPKLHYIGLNTRKKPLQDAAVRYALSQLLERERLCSGSLGNGVLPSKSFVHPAHAMYAEPEKPAHGSVDLAALFAGTEPVFIVNRENSYKISAAAEIIRMFEAAGVRCVVQELDWNSFNRALRNGEFDFYYGAVRLQTDFDLTPLLAPGGALNYGRYQNTETDGLLSAYLSADIAAAGAGAEAAALNNHLLRDMPILPIGWQSDLLCIRTGLVSGPAPTSEDLFDGIETWTRLVGK